jgi:purine-binding chemotaxis protein CheW
MDNRELVKKLTLSGEGDEAAELIPVTYRKLVIFLIEDKSYAIDSDEVREVVIVSDLYFIPFVPPYVAGLINRHGEPHTVLDLRVILDNEKLAASKVLIMNHGDDQIAFLISDILKIIQVPEGDIAAVPSSEGSSIFRGSFPFEGREVFIINAQDVYDRLQHDTRNI